MRKCENYYQKIFWTYGIIYKYLKSTFCYYGITQKKWEIAKITYVHMVRDDCFVIYDQLC